MPTVAGVDGTPDGWAVVIMDGSRQLTIQKASLLSALFDGFPDFEIVAVDVPIGLLDTYQIGGRACDRAARRVLGKVRASSVFPAPVRPVLAAASYDQACALSRGAGLAGKGISKQTFAILPKIIEVDTLLQVRPELRRIVHEVHPEVCFCELAKGPMVRRKSCSQGREDRRRALNQVFPDFPTIEKTGGDLRLPIEDILDAAVACWSAVRLAERSGRSLPDDVPRDRTDLPMAIWV